MRNSVNDRKVRSEVPWTMDTKVLSMYYPGWQGPRVPRWTKAWTQGAIRVRGQSGWEAQWSALITHCEDGSLHLDIAITIIIVTDIGINNMFTSNTENLND